jgi:hypothetical protein
MVLSGKPSKFSVTVAADRETPEQKRATTARITEISLQSLRRLPSECVTISFWI